MSIGRTLLVGSQRQAVYTVLTLVSQVVFAGIIARLVAPAAFGLFALGMAMNELLGVCTDYGAAASIGRRSVLSRRLVRRVSAPLLVRGLLATVVAGGLAGAYQFVEPTQGLVTICVAVVAAGILTQLALVAQAVSESELSYARVARGEAVSYWASTLLVTLPLAMRGFDEWALVFGFAGHGLVRALWHLPAVLRLPGDAAVEPPAPHFGRHLTLARVLNAGVLQADRLVLASIGAIGAVGVYVRAQSLASQVSTTIGVVVDRVLYPALARVHARADGSLAEHFARIVGLIVVGSLPIAIALALVSEPLIAFVFGRNWVDGAPVFSLAIAALPAVAIIRICDTVARASGRADRSVSMKALYLVVLLPLLMIAAARGATGIAAAGLAAALIMMVAQLRDAMVTVGLRERDAFVLMARLTPIACALAFAVATTALVARRLSGSDGLLAITLPVTSAAIASLVTLVVESRRRESVVGWLVAPISDAFPGWAKTRMGTRAS